MTEEKLQENTNPPPENKEENAGKISSEILLKVIEKDMVVLLACTANAAKSKTLQDDVRTKMRFAKITAKIDALALEKAALDAKRDGLGISDLKIAEGLQPIESVDGKIEWTRDYFKPGYYVDPETKKIDFRQKMSDPSVEKDEILVKVFRSTQGKNGRNVYGQAKIIPNPKDVNIKGGPNIYWDEEIKGFRAMCSGTVKLSGATLDVNAVYIARNGVNSETGNIKHNGQVMVDGDVDSDFKIESAGDVEIRGLAYACDIECGGNLIAKEGINGGSEKNIRVQGDILTKYIQNTNVKASGSITVNKEIYQCNVSARGKINVNEGRIVGGEAWAIDGITVGEVGSKGNISTLLVVGVDKNLQEKIQANHEELKRIKEMMKKLEGGYRKLKINKHLLNNAQKEAMTGIQYKIAEGEEEVQRLNEENKKIYDEIKLKAEARIKILNLVYVGTVFRIGDAHYTVEQEIAGPFIARYDRLKDEIILASEDEDDAQDQETEIRAKIEAEVKAKMEAEIREKSKS